MEDPWGNAWGDSSKPAAYGTSTVSHSVWTAPSTASTGHDDSEADLGAPSWSTGDGVGWTEPSDVQSSLWSQAEDASAFAWGSNPYADLPIGKYNSSDPSLPSSSPQGDDTASPISHESSPHTPTHTSRPQSLESPFKPPRSPVTVQSAQSSVADQSPATSGPATPDGFGSFETGLATEVEQLTSGELDPWSPAVGTFQTEQAAWSGVDTGKKDEEETMDEWEAAKREKELREKKVPPEMAAEILKECDQLMREVGPDDTVLGKDEGDGSWRSGMEGVPDLEAFMKDLLPDNPPQFVPFKSSTVAKEMLNAVRMTRNVRAAQMSPMSYFTSSSKGSIAWEASIKSKAKPAPDADVPAGWKVLEKRASLTQPLAVEEKSKKGGLLSFLSRRSSTQPPPSDPKMSRPSTPVSEPRTSSSTNEVRNSSDIAKTDNTLPSDSSTSPINRTPALSPIPITLTAVAGPPVTTSSTPQQPVLPVVFDDPQTAPPSAVSRFFNRFSRTRNSSPRNSIALSSDDIDFLSDLVPSASDEAEEDDPQLKALSKMLQSKPPDVPDKLPPPLAPPPKPASRPSSAMGMSTPLSAGAVNRPPPLGPGQPGRTSFEVLSPISISRSSTPTAAPAGQMAMRATSPLSPSLSPISQAPPVASTSRPAGKATSPLSSSLFGPTFESSGLGFGISPPPSTSLPSPPQNVSIQSTGPSFPILAPPPSSNTLQPAVTLLPSATGARSASNGLFSLPPPPPAPVRPYAPSNTIANQPSSSTNGPFDDDDFSDFQGTSAASLPRSSLPVDTGSLYDSSFSSTSSNQLYPTPERPLRTPHSISYQSSFDDFDDFVSSPLHTPSPPKLPAKSPAPQTRMHTSKSSPHIRKPSAAEHQAAINLVQRAAARQGQWPAPPSPLPNALPAPPRNGMIKPSVELDLLDEEDLPLKPPDSFNRGSLVVSTSSPANMGRLPLQMSMSGGVLRPISPPAASSRPISPPQVSLFDLSSFDSSPALTTPTVSNPVPSAPTASGKGGLSAQDLSFFEGL